MKNDIARVLRFVKGHPLTKDDVFPALGRFLFWQIQSRLFAEVEWNWIESSKLVVRRGMTGATGNIYAGLHEFADMAFLLHFLRPSDLFVDVGANIGSYTILASSVVGSRVLAIEPDPVTMGHLKRNISVNQMDHLVQKVEVAIGATQGSVQFTIGQDTTNQVSSDPSMATRSVKLTSLDLLLANEEPVFIKLDVEGYEPEAFAGARETLQKATLLAVATECDDPSIIDLLVQHHFKRVWYDPFQRDLYLQEVGVQSNALFVRDFEACQARLKSAKPIRVLNRKI
jgi:FkbM family methyltransferase